MDFVSMKKYFTKIPLSVALSLFALMAALGLKFFLTPNHVADIKKPITKKEKVIKKVVEAELKKDLPVELESKGPSRLSIDANDKNSKVRVEGRFKKGEILKVVVQGRAEDVLGTPAFKHNAELKVVSDFEAEIDLKAMKAPEGRLKISITEPSDARAERVIIHAKSSDQVLLGQLRQHKKLKSYYLQQERKRLWQTINEYSKGQIKSKSEFAELEKSTIRLAYLSQWDELREIYQLSIKQQRYPAAASNVDLKKRLDKIRKRINSVDL